MLESFKELYHLNVNQVTSSHPGVFCKKGVVKNLAKFTGKPLCHGLFLKRFIKKRLAQVFSCEFYEFFKNIFFNRTRPVAAYEVMILNLLLVQR